MTKEYSQLLDECLARAEAGEEIDLDVLATQHPTHAAALRRHLSAWKIVARALPGNSPAALVGPAIHFQSLSLGSDLSDLPTGALSPAELAQRFASRGDSIQRYQHREEIARGAMGAIVRVTDTDLARDLAMKVMLGRTTLGSNGVLQPASPTLVTRFIEEARITGRLAHPGIPSVHDFGVDSEGNFYFTMPWIRGITLADVLSHVRSGENGWDRTRVLGLLVQVCDAMAFAHSESVIHRDIKPRNVMVGEFGEVLVMDWGLARDCSREEVADVRLETDGSDESSPIKTREGVVLGTPCYMSPEQARGEVQNIGPQTDVYAVGAILYELLMGHPPYAPSGSTSSAQQVVRKVASGPPAESPSDRTDVAPELVAICERSMARIPSARYPDMKELGLELRAFLEGRVVPSFATGAWVEFSKWVGRNRTVALLVAVVLLVTTGGILQVATLERSRREIFEYSRDTQASKFLLDQIPEIGVMSDSAEERLGDWLGSAHAAVARKDHYEGMLADLNAKHADLPTVPTDAGASFAQANRMSQWSNRIEEWELVRSRTDDELSNGPTAERTAVLEREIEILDFVVPQMKRLVANLAWQQSTLPSRRFVDGDVERARTILVGHVARVQGFEREGLGGIAIMNKRLEAVRELQLANSGEHAAAWAKAIRSIADPLECPLYDGLTITPQNGLVPLGQNDGGLWEFWHVASGERPARDATGNYLMTARSGMVLILVPGGSRPIGSQVESAAGPNFSGGSPSRAKELRVDELVVWDPALDPYLLSKFEMTQGQRWRLEGQDSSTHFVGQSPAGMEMISGSHPTENISWLEAVTSLKRWGLTLPTEAQWEVAARAGAESWYWWGDSWPPPEDCCNVYDASTVRASGLVPDANQHDDGQPVHCEVDAFLPNVWGFHNTAGNVSEWCLDSYIQKLAGATVREGTGELIEGDPDGKAYRGGAYDQYGDLARVTRRQRADLDFESRGLGVRAAMKLVVETN